MQDVTAIRDFLKMLYQRPESSLKYLPYLEMVHMTQKIEFLIIQITCLLINL